MLCQVPFAQEKIARPHRVFAHGEAFLLQIADGALQCKQNAPVETLLCRRPDGIHAGVRAVRLDHIRKIDDFLQCRHIGFSGRVIRNRAANCLAFAEQRSRNRRACFGVQKLPENLKVFGKKWTTYRYDGIAISGAQLGLDAAFYEALPHTDGAVNLVMLHGGIGTACGEDMINLNLLKNRGIDYLALGHIHSYQTGPLDETGSYCYPGCLEGRGFDECGEKGFVLLTVEDGSVAHEFVPFSARQLHRVPVDITGLTQNAQIAQRMKEQARGLSPEDMVEFLLTGESDPTADISAPYLQQTLQGSFFFVKVKDESHLALDADAYRNDVSLKGEFIRQVLASELTDADKAAVIRAGLQALSGEEISL